MSMTFVKVSEYNGKPAVEVGNGAMSLKVITSGGNIVWAGAPGVDLNPLWTPEWDTVPNSLRRVAARDAEKFSQAAEDVLESQLLSCIGGHNLCCDVFGAHSEGEVKNAGLSFHGEAGLREWEVTHVDDACVTMSCHLRQSQLEVSRTYTPAPDGTPVIKVTEKLKNLVGSDRALGRSQHVTLGAEILKGGCRFSSNCDKGLTWPEDNGEDSFWAVGKEFDMPSVPRKDGEVDDWGLYPRCEKNSDLLTLRVDPSATYGYMLADKLLENGSGVAFAYAWERKAFPWLMTWEENHARAQAPWSSRALTRGMEFGSYALAMGRRWNVEKGTLLDTPTFEWLDAFEEKSTDFWISLQAVGNAGTSGAVKLEATSDGLAGPGFAMPLK